MEEGQDEEKDLQDEEKHDKEKNMAPPHECTQSTCPEPRKLEILAG